MSDAWYSSTAFSGHCNSEAWSVFYISSVSNGSTIYIYICRPSCHMLSNASNEYDMF